MSISTVFRFIKPMVSSSPVGRAAALIAFMLLGVPPGWAQVPNGPSCDTYTNKTTADGLGNNFVQGVYAMGSTVYAATRGGLGISTDGGSSFNNKTKANNGLGGDFVWGVYAISGPNSTTVYAATNTGGLGISTDGGNTFSNKTTTNGLGSNSVTGVYAVSGPNSTTVYAATSGGVSISIDGGNRFTNKTRANSGLVNNAVYGVYAVGSTVYAATVGGLSISNDGGNRFFSSSVGDNILYGVYAEGSMVYAATRGGLGISNNGGLSFTTKTVTDGLGSNNVNGVYAVGTTVYAATGDGLSISTDGGNTFTNKLGTTTSAQASTSVQGVYAVGNTVYAARMNGLSFCSPPAMFPVVTVQPASASSVCAGASVSVPVTVTGATTYQWLKGGSPVSGQTSATLTLTNIQLSDAGVYSLSATGAGGSVTSTGFSLTVNSPTGITAQPAAGSVVCVGSAVSAGVSASGTGPFMYQWYKDNLNSAVPGQTSATLILSNVTSASAGSYSVVVTGSCNSVTSTAFSLTVNAAPANASLSNTGPLTCAQTSVTLTATATGGTAYTLTGGATPQTNATGQFVVSTVGNYTVTISNASGCTATATTTVTSNTTPPVVSLSASSAVVCAPTAITLTATGTGTSFTFSAGATPVGQSNQALVIQSGTYSVTTTATNGCTATASVSVTVNQPPTAPTLTGTSRQVTTSPTPLPLTPFASATGGNALSFSGVNGFITNPPMANVTQPGVQSFSVSQTDANGCTSPATPFSLTVVPAEPPATQTVCRSSAVVLTVGLPGSRYEWYKNGQSAPFKLTEIASIQKGTATASLTVVSAQTTANYYCKVFQANGSFSFVGPYQVAVNFGCAVPGARLAASDVADADLRLLVTVAPNPVVGESLRAVVRGAGGEPLTVNLVDLQGVVVRSQHWPVADAEQVLEWDVSGRPVGLYLLRAQSNGQAMTMKVVKQ
ncbi:MAG: T9SS type A sorting domain-containing protein [Spirosoma sp.]|nr:T9SS type A sorting domain-containing protein [Spirosoma sp.]